MSKKIYGGSAVIDGVMFSDGNKYSMAIRNMDGTIIEYQGQERKYLNYKWSKLPFIRGLISILDIFSFNDKTNKMFEHLIKSKTENKDISKFQYWSALLVSFIFVGILFYLIPKYISIFIHKYLFPYINIETINAIILIIVFVAYIYYNFKFIDSLKIIRNYHGAEHKVISCHESGLDVTVENAKQFKTIHPRCGTSFIGYVIFVKLLLFNFILSGQIVNFLILKLFALPIIFSLGYELFRLMNKYNVTILKPVKDFGLWMQSLTTAEPTEDQLEVAIVAFNGLKMLESN